MLLYLKDIHFENKKHSGIQKGITLHCGNFYNFFKLSNEVFLYPFIYYSGVFCKVNILMAFCKMGIVIKNYINLLTQKNNLEWKSQKPLLLKEIARGVLRREDC